MFAVHHTRRSEPGTIVSILLVALALSFTPAHAAAVKLAWNPVPETGIQGYRIHLGTISHDYPVTYNTSQITFEVTNLEFDRAYYLAVSVIGENGLESPFSEEITVTLTAPQVVAFSDSHSLCQSSTLTVPAPGVLANDTLSSTGTLTAILDSSPAHGTISLNKNGGFTYTPAANYNGTDSFTYHANACSLDSNIVTVALSISPTPPEILVNGSFEAGTTGWTTTGNQTVQSSAPYLPTNGTKIVAFNAGNLPPNAVISQTFATVVGETYVLGFDAGVLSFNTSTQTLAVKVSGSASLVSQSISIHGTGGGSNLWQPQTISFVADSPTTTLAFQDQSPTTASIDLLLDNVKLTGPAAPPVIPADPPAIGTPTLTGTPGSMLISLQVAAAGTYVLQRSVDLVHWEQVAETVMLEPGTLEFNETAPQNALPESSVPALFYRIGSTAFASGNP